MRENEIKEEKKERERKRMCEERHEYSMKE